ALLADFELRPLRRNGVGRYWITGFFPCLYTAVEHGDFLVAEVFQEPQAARRLHSGIFLVENDLRIEVDAAQLEEVRDHRHERGERRRARVDEADAEEIEMDRAGNVALRIDLGLARIDHAQIGGAELRFELLGSCEQLGTGVRFLFHGSAYNTVEKRIQPSAFDNRM